MTIVDNVAIQIADLQDEAVLAVISALQAYEKNAFEKHATFYRQNKDIKLELNLSICVPNVYYSALFIKMLRHLRCVYTSLAFVSDMHTWSNLIVLRRELVDRLVKPSRKHLTQGYGILLGSEPGSLPDVSGLTPDVYDKKEGVLTTPNSGVVGTSIDKSKSILERVEDAFAYDAFIGDMCFESYLMCALKKPVMECVGDTESLFKWSNPKYYALTNSKSLQQYMFVGGEFVQNGN